MNEQQKQYGIEQLQFFSQKYGLSEFKMAEILLNLHDLKYFWIWVNSGEFLVEYFKKKE